MIESLQLAGSFLPLDGRIIVIEPGDGGSMTEAKELFGAGSGDETEAKRFAILAMNAVPGWSRGETIHFRTLFHFDDERDFLENMMPDFTGRPKHMQEKIAAFLSRHRNPDGILLDSERRMNVLTRS